VQPYIKFSLGVVIFLFCVYLILHYLTSLFLPFVIALILAYLIEPLVQLLERKVCLKRELAVGTAILLVISFLTILITFAIFKLYAEIVSLSNYLPEYYNQVSKGVAQLISRGENFYAQLPNPVIEVIQNSISQFYTALESMLQALLIPLTALPNFITILLISAVATYFISKDKLLISKFCWSIWPKPWQEKTQKAKKEVFSAVVAFIKVQTILVSITTLMTSIGLSLIGIKYALVMGGLVGLFDFLPILGPSTIFLPWIAYNFLVVPDHGLTVSLTVVYLIIMITRQIIEPKLVGDAIGLHPLASLMAMYVGIKLVGIAGFIIGPLTLVTLKAVIRAGLIPRLPYNRD